MFIDIVSFTFLQCKTMHQLVRDSKNGHNSDNLPAGMAD
jgi:hypothetical protein